MFCFSFEGVFKKTKTTISFSTSPWLCLLQFNLAWICACLFATGFAFIKSDTHYSCTWLLWFDSTWAFRQSSCGRLVLRAHSFAVGNTLLCLPHFFYKKSVLRQQMASETSSNCCGGLLTWKSQDFNSEIQKIVSSECQVVEVFRVTLPDVINTVFSKSEQLDSCMGCNKKILTPS